jgi:hypothetical protein
MYNKVAYIRNFVIILSFISTLLFGLEIYAEYNDIKTKYINEIISKLEILEGSNDKELSTTVKELKNKLILNKEEEFLFCAKNGSLFIKSCIWDDIPFNYKKSFTFTEDSYESYFKGLVYDDKYSVLNNKLDFTITDKDNYKSWLRENSITSERKSYLTSDFKQLYNPIIEKISNKKGIKVLILADSFGAGNGLVNIEESWPRLLENKLNSIDKFEVYLVSQHGANYKHFDTWMRSDIIDKIKPDIIILSFFENDFYYYDLMSKDRSSKLAEIIEPSTIEYLNCLNKTNFYDNLLYMFNSLANMIKTYQCDSQRLINKGDNPNIITDDVINTYSKFNKISNAPIFFFELDSKLSKSGEIIKRSLNDKGYNFFNLDNYANDLYNDFCNLHGDLGIKLKRSKFITDCSSTNPNPYDYHYNYNYMKQLINLGFNSIISKLNISNIYTNSYEAKYDYNTSNFITEALPVEFRINFSSPTNANVEFIRSTVDTILCATINREHIRLNFDSSSKKDTKIKVESLVQSKPLYLINSGYKEDKIVYKDYKLMKPGESHYFTLDLDNPSLIFASLEQGCLSQDKKYIVKNNYIYEKNINNTLRLLSNEELNKRLADFRVNITAL